jgi:hypothetical protein
VRGAGAGLIDVHDELITERAAQDFVRCGANRRRDGRIQPPERRVGFGGGFLDEDRRGHERRWRA